MITSQDFFEQERAFDQQGEAGYNANMNAQAEQDTLGLNPQMDIPALLQDTTAAERQQFVANVIQQIQDGKVDALKVHLQVKGTESLLKMFTDKKDFPNTASMYSKLVLEAAEQYGSKTFELHNAKFTIKEAGTQYNWTVCNDPVITDLLEKEKALKEDIKTRQEFLKTVPVKGLVVTDTDSGETNTIYPPAKSSSTVVSTSLK